MLWDTLKRWFGWNRKAGGAGNSRDTPIVWLGPTENRWGVPVLDVRPITVGSISVTTNQQCALNSMSFSSDDGTGFIGMKPRVTRQIPTDLKFRIDRVLMDGGLFIPQEMEHKWAIYIHQGEILFIRSWQREVMAVVETRVNGEYLELTNLKGTFITEDEDPQLSVRILDYMIRSHALDEIFPAPLPTGMEAIPSQAAYWCMSCFGNRAHFATPHIVNANAPEQPLRTDSLFHIAISRGDTAEVVRHLEAGVPIDLLDRDGLAPLHWAQAREDTAMLSLLLDRGSPVDVRSSEGATPLMNAAQSRSLEKVTFLLDHGADPNAADGRGFTTLHRAAEMGEKEIVRILLDRGASANVEAQGHSPRSLAIHRGEQAIVELLNSRG